MIAKISEIELNSIKKNLPDFKKVLMEDEEFLDSGLYKKLFISVFDHWLTNDEADNLIFIDDNKNELRKRREKFEFVINELYKSTAVFLWEYKCNGSISIQKPLTFNDLVKKCDFNNLWSQSGKRYSLILPEFSAIYSEEWDWTNIIWYIEDLKIEPLLEIAEKAGLYILKS